MNRRIMVQGVVQGVGFRPFVYQLATYYKLNGFIQNTTEGLIIELEGDSLKLEVFMDSFRKELPPLAQVDTITDQESHYVGYKNFEILKSDKRAPKITFISPDISLCQSCLDEMKDVKNRRYGYPFINCTHCGTRYSIMDGLPYDRENTSMRFFKMCHTCYKEYMNPFNRRFHAQPISCYACGPRLTLLDAKYKKIAKDKEAIEQLMQTLQRGKSVGVKGVGGFHILCDASSSLTIKKLRESKNRPSKPFAVMFLDMKMLKQYVKLTKEEEQLILSKERPIVIVKKQKESGLSNLIAPNIDKIGVFLAYTPLHYLILEKMQKPLLATSANRSSEPIITESKIVLKKIGEVVEVVLDYNRAILHANDDSVMQIIHHQKMTLRMGRGYAPKSIKLPFKSDKKILCVGANQKNSIALIIEDNIILSPYIGDMKSLEAFEYFEQTVEAFKKFYDFEPEVIVCDKHPLYMTTQWAKEYKQNNPEIQLIELQHHYAHILAGMAEFKIKEEVLGFAFDGTGYGDDKTLWGGEVLLANHQSYQRLFHLAPFRLLGGEKAIKEPRRVALALLFESYHLEEIFTLNLALLKTFSKEEIQGLYVLWKKGINIPQTTSIGRLFDGVASLLDMVHFLSFEGESGLQMESYVQSDSVKYFPFSLEKSGEIKVECMIKEMVKAENKSVAIAMFLNTLVEIVISIAKKYPHRLLVFAGGVFQNKVLMEKVVARCNKEHFRYSFAQEIPINDGGIAFGQAWYALHYLNRK